MQDTKIGHLEVVCFQKAAINQALDYIKEHATLSSKDDDVPVFSTGLGCAIYGSVIGEKLGVRYSEKAVSAILLIIYMYN